MLSIYEQVLGSAFLELHPRIQQRFGMSSSSNTASIGSGVMKLIWHNKLVNLPLLAGATRHIMFPHSGTNVPFSIENYAYRDQYGRETVTWIRKFQFPRKVRHFDATMIFSGEHGGIVDYLGNKQHMAVDLALSVSDKKGIKFHSKQQRFYEGLLQFRIPDYFTGAAEVHEWYDDDEGCYKITVDVRHPWLGPIFRYKGSFQAAFIEIKPGSEPIGIRPIREERRE
ncbi:DUF4166 domain-containing protein [Paenibacillus sinopodophylli]|uniref:DUF4166 domain-containing protein n=1 Tax=Paenibacillus sinopodophylli TaxID=1837342 RepID=UPI00110C9724|nr:DUF4166 domain-containing protein [Paenibacillus sinopodophylli]